MLRLIADSGLPKPHHSPSTGIGHALFHTATTGANIVTIICVIAALLIVGGAVLWAVHIQNKNMRGER